MDFLVHSAENLEWLESYGMLVSKVAEARDAGSVARVHTTGWGQGEYDLHPLLEAFDGELRTNIEVTAPVMDGGRVIGVRWTDLSTGDQGATEADAVVIATGGFMRNLDEIARVAPGLAARDPVAVVRPKAARTDRPARSRSRARRDAVRRGARAQREWSRLSPTRRARVPTVRRLRDLGPRVFARSLSGVRTRRAGGVLVQSQSRLSIVCRSTNERFGDPPCR